MILKNYLDQKRSTYRGVVPVNNRRGITAPLHQTDPAAEGVIGTEAAGTPQGPEPQSGSASTEVQVDALSIQEPDPQAKRDASAKKIAANRVNALKSTGPRTGEGKRRSRMNALKHGLLAKEVVIDSGEAIEEPAEFQALLDELRDVFDPDGGLEEFLVQKIATCCWKEVRGARYEVATLTKFGFPTGDYLRTILRYQTTNSRELYRAIGLLEQIQDRRGDKGGEPNEV